MNKNLHRISPPCSFGTLTSSSMIPVSAELIMAVSVNIRKIIIRITRFCDDCDPEVIINHIYIITLCGIYMCIVTKKNDSKKYIYIYIPNKYAFNYSLTH